MTDIHMANGAKFLAKDDMIVRWERKEKKVFEPETFKFMWDQLHLKAGLFVDVGAATGWFSIPYAIEGFVCVAFEPNPKVAARLIENILLNKMNNQFVEVIQAAVSDKIGETTFWCNPTLPLTSGGSIEGKPVNNPKELTVETVTIDYALRNHASVSVMKIDVEGHEMSVLRGAAGVIEESRPSLVLEANTEKHFRALEKWLDDHNYAYRRADARNLLATPL